MRHLLIDTDTASDDAVALIMALKHPEVVVEAITLVAGNVPLQQAVQNALYTAELCGLSPKIYAGAEKPLQRALETAQFVHGRDGMGDIGLDLQGRTPAEGNAVQMIRKTIGSLPHQIELMTLGPLTNIAQALLEEPGLAGMIKQCTIMGGIGQGYGNVTPVSEFNIWADPEAAKVVFESGMNLQMVGWDISRNHAWIDREEEQRIRALDTPLAAFAMDIQKKVATFAREVTKLPGFDLPDPIAMAIALDPAVITVSRSLYVEVVLSEGLTRGQTVVDHLGTLNKQPNLEVILEASREKFLSMLHCALK